MGWRFQKSIRIAPGLRLNLSRAGVGVSWGIPGFRVSTGPRGTWATASIPGTGLRYTERLDDPHAPLAAPYTRPTAGCLIGALLLGFFLLILAPVTFNAVNRPAPAASPRTGTSLAAPVTAPRVVLPTRAPTPMQAPRVTAAALAAPASTATPPTASTQTGTAATTINVRRGPSTDQPVVGSLLPGQTVTIVGCNADCTWYQLDSGAWVFAALITVDAVAPASASAAPATPAAVAWAVVNVARLNVRAAPATTGTILGTLTQGACVQVLAVQPEWFQVQFDRAQTGWCWRAYLNPVAECPTATRAAEPITAPVAPAKAVPVAGP